MTTLRNPEGVVISGLAHDSRVACGHRLALPAGDAGPFVTFVSFVVRFSR